MSLHFDHKPALVAYVTRSEHDFATTLVYFGELRAASIVKRMKR